MAAGGRLSQYRVPWAAAVAHLGVDGFQSSMPLQRVVFAGGPGGGKTTLLCALQLRGYAVVADSARTIIQARTSRSLSPQAVPSGVRPSCSSSRYPAIRRAGFW